MENPKYITYDGKRFCRDDKTGYYLNSTIHKRLHRYVWEHEVGTIPKGYQVHHIDGNKANNDISNLSLITNKGHQRLHGQEQARKEKSRQNIKKAAEKAPAWHRSDEGRKWHSEHMQGFKQPLVDKVCEQCGAVYQGIKRQRFCSNKCKSAYRRRSGADNVTLVCGYCGRKYKANKYDDTKYCSQKCAHNAHVGWVERAKSKV